VTTQTVAEKIERARAIVRSYVQLAKIWWVAK